MKTKTFRRTRSQWTIKGWSTKDSLCKGTSQCSTRIHFYLVVSPRKTGINVSSVELTSRRRRIVFRWTSREARQATISFEISFQWSLVVNRSKTLRWDSLTCEHATSISSPSSLSNEQSMWQFSSMKFIRNYGEIDKCSQSFRRIPSSFHSFLSRHRGRREKGRAK